MSKVIKEMEMNDLRATFKDVRDMVFLSPNKLTAQGEFQLRKTMRGKNVRLKQVKNSLTRRVFKEMNLSVPDNSPYWEKPTVLVWGTASGIAQVCKDLQAELRAPKNAGLYREKVEIKGAVVDGQPMEFKDALEVPSREDLVAQIVGMILGPGSAIAGCLTGPAAAVASQIEKVSEKKEEDVPAPESA